MIDERDILEQELRRFEPEPGLAERVYRRRDRKRRNQRIGAGVVGVIVALVTAILLARSFTSATVPATPTPPRAAAEGAIAYTLDGDVYVVDPDGSNVVKIADGISEQDCQGVGGGGEYWTETDDMWSPDGRYLAYRYSGCPSSREDGPKGVVISDAEGNVFAKFPTGLGWQIRWSPDSTRVAVWDDFGKTIGIYGIDGVRQTQLTVPGGAPGGDTDPYWMPDGSSVVVLGSDTPVFPLDGGAPRPASPSFFRYLDNSRDPHPRVDSPDGSRVAYVDHGTLTVARSDGSGARDISGDWVGNPTWSRKGDLIAIAAKGSSGPSSIKLRIVDAATGSETPVTDGEKLGVVGFTPHGDRILFTTESDGSRSLWSINVDGSDARRIVQGMPENFFRVPWSPEAGGG